MQVLAVVKEQQELAVRERVERRLAPAHAGPIDHAQTDGDDLEHRGVVGRRSQLAEPGAVVEARLEPACHLDRQPRLPDTADPRHRDQPALVEEACDVVEVVLTTDERRQLRRQI